MNDRLPKWGTLEWHEKHAALMHNALHEYSALVDFVKQTVPCSCCDHASETAEHQVFLDPLYKTKWIPPTTTPAQGERE